MQPGFQAANVDAVGSDRVVCVAKMGTLRAKAFQVFFGKDGSLFVSFPYFRHREGILSVSRLPANGEKQTTVHLEQGGKVTSHRIKYSHHPSGRANFSQTGKIRTEIFRQSVSLDIQHGHIFSLQIQGLQALESPDSGKQKKNSNRRTTIEFEVPQSDAIKFVARWFDATRMRFSNPTPTIGPWIWGADPDGTTTLGCLIANPYLNARHVLLITLVPSPRLGSEPEIFIFSGGFDPQEIMTDATKDAECLMFKYPVEDVEAVKQRIGSVDYMPER